MSKQGWRDRRKGTERAGLIVMLTLWAFCAVIGIDLDEGWEL